VQKFHLRIYDEEEVSDFVRSDDIGLQSMKTTALESMAAHNTPNLTKVFCLHSK